MLIDDEIIMAKLKEAKSKDSGFKLLMESYQRPLYLHIYKMVKNHQDTDDCLQNTFIKVYKNVDKFRGESKLYSWLFRIATNETLTFLSKEKRIRSNAESLNPPSMVSEHDAMDGEKIMTLLYSAVEQLPDKQKQVFNLRYFEKVNYTEMSLILGTSKGALKASYHHAIKKIEAILKKQ